MNAPARSPVLLALRRSIYREYLQETSFLYGQRKMALEAPAFGLEELAALEARMEAHLDGLVLGADEARAFCKLRVPEGDVGELHGILRVLCRTDRPEDLEEVSAAADPSAPECARAMSDALRHDLPAAWASHAAAWLSAEQAPPPLQAAVAVAAGYRRLPVVAQLVDRVKKLQGAEVVPYIEALGRLRVPSTAMLLFRFMQQRAEPEVARTAAIAALRVGSPQALAVLEQAAGSEAWARIPLALAANAGSAPLLLGAAREDPCDDSLLALGIMGDIAATPLLVKGLMDGKSASSAALALYLITGARLSDATVDPASAPGISLSPELWGVFLRDHVKQMAGKGLHRLGEPRAANMLLRCLGEPWLPLAVRRLVTDEIVIRFRVDVGYAPDMLAHEQRAALSKLAQALGPADTAGRAGGGAASFREDRR